MEILTVVTKAATKAVKKAGRMVKQMDLNLEHLTDIVRWKGRQMETPEASRRTMDEATVQSLAEETRLDSHSARKRDSNLETLRVAN